ncbi:MAG TPA: Ig-like domain-containing protein [Gaiellaceae bacterium]|jgi:dienelactone hydrolase
MRPVVGAALALCAAALIVPGGALAATSAGQPFPSNLYTTPDATQLTGLQVGLPRPNCATQVSDCQDIAVLATLDGFDIQPRISIPFSGPIDLSTVTSKNIFLVGPGDHVIGINQAEWEPADDTLHVESNDQLAQDTTYLLVVTRGVHAADGSPLSVTDFRHDLNFGQAKDRGAAAYRKALLGALPMAMAGGADEGAIADASLFTTQSITAISEKIRAQLQATPVSFNLGTHGERTVFPVSALAAIRLHRQIGTATFADSFVYAAGSPLQQLLAGVGTIAYGSYASPDYENANEVIPAVGTKTGVPAVQSVNNLEFSLWLPAGAAPAGGWPVAIFGHGFTDSKDGAPLAVAGTLARNGIATIAINVVGHGGGPLGAYTAFLNNGATVTLTSGGRGIDQDGNGTIDSTEGVNAIGAQSLVGNRDGLRQTVIDLMQLVKELKAGVDVSGDGTADLSTSRIYYAGQSFGGIYGVQLLGLEPDIRAGVPNVPGGPITEIARLSPSFRGLVGFSLLTRMPSVYNAVPNPPALDNFNENIPLRNLPIRVDTVPGASAIQTVLENDIWAQQAANPAAYAPFITAPVIIQFARGDETVPNPTTTAILRAGNLASRATLFRNDLAVAANPAVAHNPHTFLTNVGGAGAAFAFEAQQQIATFFASDGATVIDPDGSGPFFETPTSILPEDLGYLP